MSPPFKIRSPLWPFCRIMEDKMRRRFTRELKALCESGKTLDQTLGHFRVNGVLFVDCVLAVQEHTGCSLAEAKDTVSSTPAWHAVAAKIDKDWSDYKERLAETHPNSALVASLRRARVSIEAKSNIVLLRPPVSRRPRPSR